MKPLVYIVLVNYNGAKDTIDCIKSLEKIDYDNFKVIIVDNCSTDNSIEVLKKHNKKNHIIIESNYNNGFSAGNNIGIKRAMEEGADFVLLLNNDTIVKKDFLSELIKSTNEDVGICIGKIYYLKEKNKIWYGGGKINFKTGKVMHIDHDKIDFKLDENYSDVTFATGCCMLISKKVLKTIGFLDERYFLYYEDSDYSAKILNAGLRIRYNPKSIIYHNVSSSTGRGSNLTQYYMIRNRLLFIKYNIEAKYKVRAYLYFYIKLVFAICKCEYNFKIVCLSITDFLKNKKGKAEKIF